MRREHDRVRGLLLIGFASGFYCHGSCSVDQDPKNPNRRTPSYLVRETKEKHKTEDRTEKADAMEHRIKDKCDERANEWADGVYGRLTCLTR